MTYEELDRRAEMAYTVYGWMLHSVEPEPGSTGWSYTVGLGENFDHPDVVMLDGPFELKQRMVRHVAQGIVDGQPDVDQLLVDVGMRLTVVDPLDLPADTFNGWIDRYHRPPVVGDYVLLEWP